MSEPLRESFHAPGVFVLLVGEPGGCLLDLSLRRTAPPTVAVDVEVLLVPRNRDGLVAGPTHVLLRSLVTLHPVGDRLVGRLFLPEGLAPQTARNCHYRVRRITM